MNHIAAVQLGTLVEYHWKFGDEHQAKKITLEGFDYIILTPEDKAFVRENILQCLYITTNKQIVKQYTRCITTMARFDYPGQWPSLLTQVMSYLS